MSFLLPCEVKYKQNGNKTRDIARLRGQYGTNSFTRRPRNTFLSQYLSAFGDPIIKILLVALALNIVIAIKNAELYEPLGIAVALFLATFVSTLSEYGSESAFIKLEQQSSGISCRVMRDGRLTVIQADELVVTDTVLLSAGERVPADGVIITGRVFADQSPLNGESAETAKYPSEQGRAWELDNHGQLFRGSVITSGECIMSVCRTGDTTFYGGVAVEIQGKSARSPLTERLSSLARVLSIVGYCAAGLVFSADLFNSLILDNAFDSVRILAEIRSPVIFSDILHAVTLAITVVVVAVPEGLPMMITVVLSSNMRKLKRDNVLVRRLVGIETGGSLNILFCDKTGTLTGGKLSVSGYCSPDGIRSRDIPKELRDDAVRCMILSNDAMMVSGRPTGGNSTDRALLSYACSRDCDSLEITGKIPFDSVKKYAAARSRGVWYIKGAPEVIFSHCGRLNAGVSRCFYSLASEGARVIALATSTDLVSYTLIGLVSITDRLRADARASVKSVQTAGVSVCMVTGDNAETARSVADACGILRRDGVVLTSSELSEMSDSEVKDIIPRLCVVARALPTDKSRLVRLSQESGLVCGMTGDGINDAPALKRADVGFAMGSGTEVAKQAGDIVILDDNFTSIARAVLYGRTIFKSIRKFIVFQLTMNLCAVGVSVIGPFIGIDTPVTVLQMLWINIIMDTLAGLAYAGEPPLSRYMLERPVSRREHVLNGRMAWQILSMGIYSLILCTAFLACPYFKEQFGFYTDYRAYMTAFFALFVFSGVFGAFNARTDRANVLSYLSANRAFLLIILIITAVQLWLIYFGGAMFRTCPIPISRLLAVISLSATVIPFDIMRKLISSRFIRNN